MAVRKAVSLAETENIPKFCFEEKANELNVRSANSHRDTEQRAGRKIMGLPLFLHSPKWRKGNPPTLLVGM